MAEIAGHLRLDAFRAIALKPAKANRELPKIVAVGTRRQGSRLAKNVRRTLVQCCLRSGRCHSEIPSFCHGRSMCKISLRRGMKSAYRSPRCLCGIRHCAKDYEAINFVEPVTITEASSPLATPSAVGCASRMKKPRDAKRVARLWRCKKTRAIISSCRLSSCRPSSCRPSSSCCCPSSSSRSRDDRLLCRCWSSLADSRQRRLNRAVERLDWRLTTRKMRRQRTRGGPMQE